MYTHSSQTRLKDNGIFVLVLLTILSLTRIASAQTHPPLYVPPDPIAIHKHEERERRYQEIQERPQVTVKGNTIVIRVPNLTRRPGIPLLALARMTQRYPNTQYFRVRWNCYIGLCTSHSSVFYDRVHHTVLLTVTGNIGKAEHSIWHRSLFTNVTDRAIAENASKHWGVVVVSPNFFAASPLAFFNDLINYGCHVQTFPEPPPIWHPIILLPRSPFWLPMSFTYRVLEAAFVICVDLAVMTLSAASSSKSRTYFAL